ncbi:hypothetical protein IQ07DRAFT_640639 [Pyrenochaeta sp. DS3sAY3a]|nr:hypothetical protein IQ07DRAFT_640639 [Pyrenochaeta sp. DS3sAY3a]
MGEIVTTTHQILDIGGSKLHAFNKTQLEKKLLWSSEPFTTLNGHVQRVLPTSIVYGDKGLEIWSRITHLPSYYQTSGEAALFAENAKALGQWVHKDSVLIDLGCGDIRKLMPLLSELGRLQKPQTQLCALPCITATGLWGTFDDGVNWAAQHCGAAPRLFLSLGSMFGNDHFDDAVARLRWLRDTGLRTPHDMLLLTLDGTQDAAKICASYDDASGLFTQLIRSGFADSNRVLGRPWYRAEDWALVRRLSRNPTMHRFVLRAKRDVECPVGGVVMWKGEEIDCYEGFKYGPEEMARQFEAAGLREYARWKGPDDDIYQYLLGSDEFCASEVRDTIPESSARKDRLETFSS